MGMTVTSAPSERVFSRAGEVYSAKGTNLGIGIFTILIFMRMNPHLVGYELNLD